MFELTKISIKAHAHMVEVGAVFIFELCFLPLSILGVTIAKVLNKE